MAASICSTPAYKRARVDKQGNVCAAADERGKEFVPARQAANCGMASKVKKGVEGDASVQFALGLRCAARPELLDKMQVAKLFRKAAD
jgi:hypothetical protein